MNLINDTRPLKEERIKVLVILDSIYFFLSFKHPFYTEDERLEFFNMNALIVSGR